MKRIETSTKASDLFGPGKHGFTDGDPVNGVLATRLNAEFFNQVQEEIASVIEGYGGELDGSNRQQLLQAIQSAIAAIPPIPEARTHQAGLVELATQTETETGTSETRAVTPKALKKRLDDLSQELAQVYATVNAAGLVELATQSEVNTGTSDSRAVTPKTLAQKLDTLHFIPPGAVMYFAMNTPPEGWLLCDGRAVSRTTYADLFEAIGTTFGSGSGYSSFKLPELRGEFIRGWNSGRNVDSGRSFGSAQSDAFKSHRHVTYTEGGQARTYSTYGAVTGNSYRNTLTSYTNSVGGSETRPRNVALLPCIKT